MPIYEFKCPKCEKYTEVFVGFSEFQAIKEHEEVDFCKGKCKLQKLYKSDQVINFAGGINMNASAMGISQRKYNNKMGGPHGIIGGSSTGKATAKKGGLNIGPTGL